MSLPYVLSWSFGSGNTAVKYSKMANERHCHMFSGGVSEVQIQMLSSVTWQMGVTSTCSLEEFRK